MASFATPNVILNLATGTDLSTKQYKALALGTDGAVDVAGANVSIIGILQNSPTLGKSAEIASLGGGSKAIAGGTITANDMLKTDANGDLVTANPGDVYAAIAIEDAVDNDVFQVLVLQATSTAATPQELTATGTVTPGIQSVELNHATVAIASTLAAAINSPGFLMVKDTSASGTAAHTFTMTAGTVDGSNNVLTFNAPNEAVLMYIDSAGNGTIIENVGGVAIS